MACAHGEQNPDLKKELLAEGRRFSFIQAIRFLCNLIRKEMGLEAQEHDVLKRIKVRPDLSLAFPETDVVSIEETSKQPSRFLVTATFLGLYGTSSPLPAFYTEDLLQEQAHDQHISRGFIDIFSARIYHLYFMVWSRYRLFFKLVEHLDQATLERLYCLLGFGGERLREQIGNPYGMLRYIGLTTQFPRSAEGMRALLADGLAEPSLQIVQCVERLVEIPEEQKFILGVSGNRLGENACLGSEISDWVGKFRVRVGPLNSNDFDRFLPDKPAFNRLGEFIRFYLDQPLTWDLEALLQPDEAATAQLGKEQWSRLGWNTWLFSEGQGPENTAVRFCGTY